MDSSSRTSQPAANLSRQAVILLSGGLDSATAGAIARDEGFELYALSVNYGQRHRFELEAAHTLPPDKLFERRWALALLDQVLGRLRAEFEQAGKERLFERLKAFLQGSKNSATYPRVADELKMSEGAIKVAVHRLRRRYRELLREEIARTLDDPSQVDAEIRELFVLLGS